jgi:hypothetical protein
MTNTGYGKRLLFLLVLNFAFSTDLLAQASPDFSGDWALKLGNRIFIAVSLAPARDDTGHYGGWLSRPKQFSTSGAPSFSGIEGPVIRFPVVASSVKENCLSFTTQNPTDADDKDDFKLCVTSASSGTLKIDVPGFDAWPLEKEKGPLAVATDWDKARAYLVDSSDVSSPEMKQIFERDQKDRQAPPRKINWEVVDETDAQRREATRKLLADGKLHTGEDFERAAFVFQHGSSPDDYLVAHTLAMVAVARGQSSAIWISAATLDRYLNSIHQPQIYGTQFLTPNNAPVTQEPYNRTLISDALRRQLGVPSLAAQQEQKKQYEREASQP